MMQQPPNEKQCEETKKTQPITGKMPSVAFLGIDIPTFDQVMKHAGFVSNSTHTQLSQRCMIIQVHHSR
jgi:hypothetical protein